MNAVRRFLDAFHDRAFALLVAGVLAAGLLMQWWLAPRLTQREKP